MGWEKIGVLVLAAVLIIFWGPRALRAAKNAPKGTSEDWKAFLIPILLVVGFVILLIMSVR
ncbi:MAG: hypothetical protein GC149_00065 [Gammaproteobacteria bacterium]|nr:hypothetical protein [Gammaproteobacteria bacterium]